MRKVCFTIICMAFLLSVTATNSFAWPDRVINMVIPFSAGGSTDAVGRALLPAFKEAIGGNVIVKNISGAAGTMGASEVAQAKPDGYTFGLLPVGPTTLQPHLRKLPYGRDSWEPVALLTANPMVLMVPTNSRFKSLKDLIEEAKANPGKLIYGSSGPGSLPHVGMVNFTSTLGLKMKHIPDRGGAHAMKSLAGNVTQVVLDGTGYLKRFDVRGLALLSEERSQYFPEISTVKELGYDVSAAPIWIGVFLPRGTADNIVERYADAVLKAANSELFKQINSNNTTPIKLMGRDKFTKFYENEFDNNGRILKAAGLKK